SAYKTSCALDCQNLFCFYGIEATCLCKHFGQSYRGYWIRHFVFCFPVSRTSTRDVLVTKSFLLIYNPLRSYKSTAFICCICYINNGPNGSSPSLLSVTLYKKQKDRYKTSILVQNSKKIDKKSTDDTNGVTKENEAYVHRAGN
uniref:Uncharacterized protein n=1 Tax=Anopheles atroparvus TaxID=41427 RepID=A0AAG5D1V1_ANOAO